MAAASAFGTTLTMSGAKAGITSLSGPGIKIDMIDTTSHSSTSAYRTFVEGLVDGGEISMDIIFDDTNELAWKALVREGGATGTATTIVWPGTITWAFYSFLTSFEPTAPHDGSLTASITIKVTGVITYDTD